MNNTVYYRDENGGLVRTTLEKINMGYISHVERKPQFMGIVQKPNAKMRRGRVGPFKEVVLPTKSTDESAYVLRIAVLLTAPLLEDPTANISWFIAPQEGRYGLTKQDLDLGRKLGLSRREEEIVPLVKRGYLVPFINKNGAALEQLEVKAPDGKVIFKDDLTIIERYLIPQKMYEDYMGIEKRHCAVKLDALFGDAFGFNFFKCGDWELLESALWGIDEVSDKDRHLYKGPCRFAGDDRVIPQMDKIFEAFETKENVYKEALRLHTQAAEALALDVEGKIIRKNSEIELFEKFSKSLWYKGMERIKNKKPDYFAAAPDMFSRKNTD